MLFKFQECCKSRFRGKNGKYFLGGKGMVLDSLKSCRLRHGWDHSLSTPLALKVMTIMHNPLFKKFLDPTPVTKCMFNATMFKLMMLWPYRNNLQLLVHNYIIIVYVNQGLFWAQYWLMQRTNLFKVARNGSSTCCTYQSRINILQCKKLFINFFCLCKLHTAL